MKIITNINDISSLVKGDQYVIQPIGYDLQKPEKLSDFSKEINDIQKAIEDKIAPKEVIIKTDAELNKMTEKELIVYGLTIGADVNTKYTKAKNLENVKAKQ